MNEEIKKEVQDEQLNPEELDKVAGGAEMIDPSPFSQMRFTFTEADVKALERYGFHVEVDKLYTRANLNALGISGNTIAEMKTTLQQMGVKF